MAVQIIPERPRTTRCEECDIALQYEVSDIHEEHTAENTWYFIVCPKCDDEIGI
jgi:Zn finger protein HypA/HybF involved in hydrogenase expression